MMDVSIHTFVFKGKCVVLHPTPPSRQLIAPVIPPLSGNLLMDSSAFPIPSAEHAPIICLAIVLEIPPTTVPPCLRGLIHEFVRLCQDPLEGTLLLCARSNIKYNYN